MLASSPVLAADVTPERLLNPDKEPQNWLMNHRTYDGQRFSPLARINHDNVKNLKLAYAVPLGGGAGNEFANATPLAEDGFLYVTDSWNVLYKIDVRSGDVGRVVWRMDPKQDRQMRSRGAALWGNLVITGAGGFGNSPRIIATDKETGKVVWETSFQDTPDVTFTAAPLAIKDKIIVGAANGDQGVRDWIAGLDAATGKRLWLKYTIPAPGEPGSETWKGDTNAWRTGGAAVWVTGTYDPATNQTMWGTGNPVPMFDPFYRPGDNLYTNSVISYNPDIGNMNWYFQFTPGDMWDYDEVGTHILIDDQVGGQSRQLIIRDATAFSTRWNARMARWCSPSRIRRSTGPKASTRRRASRSTMIRPGTFRFMPGLATSAQMSRRRESVRHCWAATIIGPARTAAKPSCCTSRRCRTARRSPSIGKSTPRRRAGTAALPRPPNGGRAI
jgi:alcohol dehydrogenase (cytochrome c)